MFVLSSMLMLIKGWWLGCACVRARVVGCACVCVVVWWGGVGRVVHGLSVCVCMWL